jgi:hypothetical protein
VAAPRVGSRERELLARSGQRVAQRVRPREERGRFGPVIRTNGAVPFERLDRAVVRASRFVSRAQRHNRRLAYAACTYRLTAQDATGNELAQTVQFYISRE